MRQHKHYWWRLSLGIYLGVSGILALIVNGLTALPAQAACTALPTTNGTVTFTVNAPSTTTYRFWAHIYSPSAGKDGVYLQIDNTTCQVTVGNAAVPAGQFTWVDYQNGTTSSKINVNLTAGSHTVELAGLDVGVGVDKIMLLTDLACAPTGDGSNCVGTAATPTPTPGATPTPVPTVVITPAPGSGTTNGGTPVSGVVTLPKPTSPGTTRTYYVDGQPVASDKLDTSALSNGNHTLEIVDKGPDGKTKVTSQKLVVNNPKTWWQKVLAWVLAHLLWVIIGLVVVLGGGGALWWFKLRIPGNQADSLLGNTNSPLRLSDEPPAQDVIYPDKSDRKP
ncbi:MAG TPA: hypothetical protein VLI05_06300 [Candidatus Saccharimonadia bacterium]|nr:hypothetical protein [Candidatus Saccharimonadia bacterium]